LGLLSPPNMDILYKAFNQLSTEIIILDQNLRILTMNEAAVANGWLGYSIDKPEAFEQLINKSEIEASKLIPLQSLLNINSFDLLDDTLRMAREKASAITVRDMLLMSKDGMERTVDLTVSLSNEFDVFILEISNVDNLNRIINSTRTDASQKIAAGLARSLAHEVKNQLAGIKGAAQLIKMKSLDSSIEKFIKIIEDETERLSGIVSKILTPAAKPNLASFNIHEVLERVIKLTQASDESAEVSIEKDYDPSIPEIYGDKNLFIQAILNVVQNASHASLENSEPKIGVKSRISFNQPINGKIQPTILEIIISDNGNGINPDNLDHIFFPMISTKEGGSGLGLSIAQDIIKIHKGIIRYERSNEITKFIISIPIMQSLSNQEVVNG
jgi:two-component system nitrogen regulation sensor histidine kinase GlnL